MARYIDADALLGRLPDDLPYKGSVKRVLMQAPTADVAPKSEVAREIFGEIAKQVASKIPMQIRPIFEDDLNFEDGFRNGKADALYDVLLLVAELKKKYTEEKEK